MTDVEKYGNVVLPIGTIITIIDFRRNRSFYEVVGVVENSTITWGKEYEVYELKADKSGVKGKRQVVIFPYPSTKTKKNYYVTLPEPNKSLISQKEVDSDNRRLSQTEIKLEWKGVKPAYLMTKDEYKKEVYPKFKEFNKFIEKNIEYFSKDGYYGLDYKDWQKFKNDYKPTPYGDAESSFKYNRGRKYENLDIKQASDEQINKLNEYLDYFKSIFGDKYIKKIEPDESTSNKRSIRRAIDDGTYEKLLRDGVINYAFIKTIFDSVGLNIPTKLEKIEKEVVEYGLTTSKVKDIDTNTLKFINDLKAKFNKEINEYREKFYNYYYNSIKNIYEFSELNKNSKYKDINDFYAKYSEYKGITLVPKYKIDKNFRGEPQKIFIGYENLHGDTYIFDEANFKIFSFNDNKVIVNSDWENILNKAATEYADNLFQKFAKRVLMEISIINEIPNIAHGYIKDLTQKGFEAYLDLVYKNGFVLNIETQVIYAGGINIQVLHLRGLFKTRNAGKYVSNAELIKLYNEFNPINDIEKQELYAKKLEEGDERELDKIAIKEQKSEERVYDSEILDLKKKNRKKKIKELELLIELTEESIKDDNDEELKLYLESLKNTLENIKSKKFEDGDIIKEKQNNNMDSTLEKINNTVFYRYYHVNASPFEVSIDPINKYGKGIYFLDNPYYYKDKFKDGMLLTIKPKLKNPKIYVSGSSVIPNAGYSSDIIDSLKNGIKDRNEFSNKLIREGYDSLVAVEPRGIYLVLLYNDPENYEIISDKKNIMAVGGEIKPLDFVSESMTISIEDLITKGEYNDLTLVEALFFFKAFKNVEYGRGIFLSKEGAKGIIIKKLMEAGYIDESWLIYYEYDTDYNDYSPTEKGYKFLNAIANRHRTRLGLKEGIDLFPETANVKEYDERIAKNREKLNKLIESLK